MPTSKFVPLVALTVCLTATVHADRVQVSDVRSRASGAERVVVAVVESVQPVYDRNEFGDDLIVSRTWVRVREVLKGAGLPGQQIEVDVEGGTIGDIRLDVSDMPSVQRGETAVLFLARNKRGRLVPHMRGLGILKLDKADRVQDSDVTLSELRPLLRGR